MQKWVNQWNERLKRNKWYIRLNENKYYRKAFQIQKIFNRKEVRILPAYISFYFLLSFIPLLVLVMTLLALVNQNQQLITLFKEVFPEDVYLSLTRLVGYFNMGNAIFTFSNILLLLSASRIYYSIYHSNSIILKTKCCRNFFFDKLIALASTLAIIITVLVLVTTFVLGRYINIFLYRYFTWNSILSSILMSIIGVSAIILFTTVIMLSLPDNEFKLKKVWRGSIVSALMMVVTSVAFKIYVDSFKDYSSVYYTFSTLLVFVLWIYFMSYAIVIGLVINYYFNEHRNHNSSMIGQTITERSRI